MHRVGSEVLKPWHMRNRRASSIAGSSDSPLNAGINGRDQIAQKSGHVDLVERGVDGSAHVMPE